MKLIVSVDLNHGIGKNGGLLFHIQTDMDRFRELTTGNAVVMGRKTLESLPGGRPLPNRRNIVLTRDSEYNAEGIIVCNTIKELCDMTAQLDCDIFIIGGGEIYRQLLPLCDTAYITRVYADREADTFMPELNDTWKLESRSEVLREGDLRYCFETYTRDFTAPSCLVG